MNFDTRNLPTYEADALVVGSGVAGLSAAWRLAEAGKRVLLAVRDTLSDSNTDKAQGGIASSFGADDNPTLHLEDTLVAGELKKMALRRGCAADLIPDLRAGHLS